MPFNFGALEPEFSSLKGSDFVIIPVPYDLTTSYISGSRRGPLAIIDASTHVELYDEELKIEPYRRGIHTLSMVEPATQSPAAMVDRVSQVCEGVLVDKKTPILIGGEHSLSVGMVRALSSKYKDLSVLQFDAHADLRDIYEGSPYNHACVGRRISELCPLTQVGIRSLSSGEAVFLRDSDIKTITASDVLHSGVPSEITTDLTDDVYITIDLDVFDPSVMPAVGTPEPGGLFWYDLLNIIKKVVYSRRIVGFDVVELSPVPGLIAPDFTAAKLIYRIIGYLAQNEF